MFHLPKAPLRSTCVLIAMSIVALCDPSRFYCAATAEEPFNAADVEFFESRIRPVLVEHCYECHSADSTIVRGGLQLDHRSAFLDGGDSGPVITPGEPDESLLISALRHETMEMPPDNRLPDEVVADFVTWIERGAVDPRTEVIHGKLRRVDWDSAAKHWAFQRISDPTPPNVIGTDSQWIRNPIDQFIARKLQDSGYTPATQAGKRTLIRRATFDLIGLPPTPAQIDDFLKDESIGAFSKVVDRLLASPLYGERWGRHWLDLVRYANTSGADENHPLPNAWKYRDWVVQSFNKDLRLDDFIVRQLAGDLLPTPTDDQAAGDLLTATGMLVIGPKMLAEQDKDKMMIDIVDEQIDTVSRTMLGLTIACARCHDHKFDPISAEDYYSLAGIFSSTKTMADRAFVSQWMERPRPSKMIEAERVAHQLKIDEAASKLAQMRKMLGGVDEAKPEENPVAEAAPVTEADIEQQKQVVDAIVKEMPGFEMVMAVEEGPPIDLPIHVRGDHLTPGPDAVPRGMPSILTDVCAAPTIPDAQSGRLELARWIVSPNHPLTSRVMVNRIWMWHFGTALMRNPSNFGLQAEPPTHPELLDWLARELIRRDWSLKEMHRLIMLSSTYQMSSQAASENVAEDEEQDPENRLMRRQNRRRLEAEPVRDSILFVGGELDLAFGDIAANTQSHRRAIYLPINRANSYDMFSAFDYVETANHIEQRPTTTTPQQSLFMMNDPIVIRQAGNLAKQLLQLDTVDTSDATADRERIEHAFEQLFARPPSDVEAEQAEHFLHLVMESLPTVGDVNERQQTVWAALCRTLIATNEFIHVD